MPASLRHLVLRAVARALPERPGIREAAVPDDDSAHVRVAICAALQSLTDSGEVGHWTVKEVGPDWVEVAASLAYPLDFETMRFSRSDLQDLCAVMDVMES